jgi:predicted enzyme related to lactoylglutathione lyase
MHSNWTTVAGMATANRISPIFPVRDVTAALEFYARLGFTTRADEGAEYGFAVLGDVELHLGGPLHRSEPAPHGAYLYVDDADEFAERWNKAGAEWFTAHPRRAAASWRALFSQAGRSL